MYPMMVMNWDLDSGLAQTNMYTVPEYVNATFYREAVNWLKGSMVLEDTYISVSDINGSEIIPLITDKRSVNLDGLGMLEIELRGFMASGNFETRTKTFYYTKEVKPHLHFTNGVEAYVIDASEFISKEDLKTLIECKVKPKLKKYFKKLKLGVSAEISTVLPSCKPFDTETNKVV